jgi:hypothetical protein
VRRSRPSSRKNLAPPPGSKFSLFTRPVLCAYCPLRIEALEGQHTEVVSKALEKLVPSSAHAESSVVREKTDLSRSSARMRITLGLLFGWGAPGSAFSRPRPRSTTSGVLLGW